MSTSQETRVLARLQGDITYLTAQWDRAATKRDQLKATCERQGRQIAQLTADLAETQALIARLQNSAHEAARHCLDNHQLKAGGGEPRE